VHYTPLAALCTSLADVEERTSHSRPVWFRKGKAFVYLHPDGHHQNTFPHLWVAAAPGRQEELVAAFPDRFFRPPYVGHLGWVGVRMHDPLDWDAVAALVRDAWEAAAPRPKKRPPRP